MSIFSNKLFFFLLFENFLHVYLLGNDRQHLQVNSVELIEAGPGTS